MVIAVDVILEQNRIYGHYWRVYDFAVWNCGHGYQQQEQGYYINRSCATISIVEGRPTILQAERAGKNF